MTGWAPGRVGYRRLLPLLTVRTLYSTLAFFPQPFRAPPPLRRGLAPTAGRHELRLGNGFDLDEDLLSFVCPPVLGPNLPSRAHLSSSPLNEDDGARRAEAFSPEDRALLEQVLKVRLGNTDHLHQERPYPAEGY
jgi:hypothetical protein